MDTGSLLALVLAGHFVGDWVLQSDWQAANKTTNWWAMLGHVFWYHVAMFIAISVIPSWYTWQAGVLVGVSWVTHMVIDRRWPTRLILRVTFSPNFSEVFWGVIAADQAIHLSILCLLVYYLGGNPVN